MPEYTSSEKDKKEAEHICDSIGTELYYLLIEQYETDEKNKLNPKTSRKRPNKKANAAKQ